MSRAMVWWMSIMAFLNTAVAGTTLAGYLGDKQAGLAALTVASLQAATAAYSAASNRKGNGSADAGKAVES